LFIYKRGIKANDMKKILSSFLSAFVPALLFAVPVQAQSLGAYAQNCRVAPPYGSTRYAGCGAGAGSAHVYERWEDGSTTSPGMTPPTSSGFQYRGFSSVHDYGR
jgi:hypothetical protein